MNNIKQVIVVRKDLNMRKGKIAAQVAHASMGLVLSEMMKEDFIIDGFGCEKRILTMTKTEPLYHWLNGSFTKICVSCNSEKELLELEEAAEDAHILTYLITDNGLTEFHGVPTKTCLAIGPDFSEKIDQITGHLSLL